MSGSTLCIIPARGGSKRIPGKNIKEFLGKPIIAYSIEAALDSGLFEEVMVSTDDKEIAKIGRNYGAAVPFLRSEKSADDFATTVDVLLEVLEDYRKLDKNFETVCCIYPTAPFVNAELIKKAFHKLINERLDSVFPVIRYSFPIQRAIIINDSKKVQMLHPENMNKRSQDLLPTFHDAGQFYFFKSDIIKEDAKLWTNNSGCIEVNDLEAQDIDNITDWKLAELKYQLLHGK